jgi:hypothetical protein
MSMLSRSLKEPQLVSRDLPRQVKGVTAPICNAAVVAEAEVAVGGDEVQRASRLYPRLLESSYPDPSIQIKNSLLERGFRRRLQHLVPRLQTPMLRSELPKVLWF